MQKQIHLITVLAILSLSSLFALDVEQNRELREEERAYERGFEEGATVDEGAPIDAGPVYGTPEGEESRGEVDGAFEDNLSGSTIEE